MAETSEAERVEFTTEIGERTEQGHITVDGEEDIAGDVPVEGSLGGRHFTGVVSRSDKADASYRLKFDSLLKLGMWVGDIEVGGIGSIGLSDDVGDAIFTSVGKEPISDMRASRRIQNTLYELDIRAGSDEEFDESLKPALVQLVGNYADEEEFREAVIEALD